MLQNCYMKKHPALLLLTVVLLSVCPVAALYSQTTQVIVQGKIVSSKDKSPIHGASITEIDKEDRIVRGVATDIEGNFAIRISNPKNKLSISYIGFKTLVMAI